MSISFLGVGTSVSIKWKSNYEVSDPDVAMPNIGLKPRGELGHPCKQSNGA